MLKFVQKIFQPKAIVRTFPKEMTKHLKMDDWNPLFELLNLTTCYDTFDENKTNGTQLVFQPNGKELRFFMYYSTEFGRRQSSYRSDVYQIIDTVIEHLTFEQKEYLYDNFYDEEYTNYDFLIKFNYRMLSKCRLLMSELCREILVFDNIRIRKIGEKTIDFYADCRDYKDMLITVYSGYYPSWTYSTTKQSLNVSRDILSNYQPVFDKYPGISFEMFETYSDSFTQNFVSKPIVKEYLNNPQYQLISTFDDSKKIPKRFCF